MQQDNSIGSQKMGIYCAWIFSALTVIGWLGIAQFYAPVPGDVGLEATKTWFVDSWQWGTIVGCTIFYIACAFLVPASVQFGIMLSKIEGRYPLWSIVTAVGGIFISLIIFLNCCAWIVAAYRPETGADVIQAWYDWAWLAFLLGWVYLSLEMFATAIVELGDKRPEPMVPRPFAWLTVLGGVALVTAGGPAFFKSGPFAYNGLLGFYVPMAIWGVYVNGTAWFMYRELCREEEQLAGHAAASSRPGAVPSAAG
ncbi:MAG: hypothetical protein L0H19_04235 [Salinisphaera sp.]|nr:hypothetical protein [Salinisphaera sp.]MDN5937896.1 hypothetical protein [Salinisphaera sp.]